ncbi:MxaK protein [Rhizobacter sp. Root404]|uniref:MxaK protein n=1 Tax=Rhizobacter sp. Root404 TaxID=1736528 RepID=UPI000AD4CCE9|nr:MxaK protein [Rhizobacter sp. Root404]
MGLATRSRTRLVLALLAAALLAVLFDAAALWRAAQTNARIEKADSAADQPGEPPELRFARAHAQAQDAAASSARDAALNRYRALQGDPRLGAAARYNSANLLVRQAIEVRASAQPGQAIALLELAKEYYRDVLRDDPTNWDARYNLERAQRLLPDPDDDDAGPVTQERNRERAVTTMRGYSPGLP